MSVTRRYVLRIIPNLIVAWAALCLAAQPVLAQQPSQPVPTQRSGEAIQEPGVDDIRKSLNDALRGVQNARVSLEQATEKGGIAAPSVRDNAVQMLQQIKSALLQVRGLLLQESAPEVHQALRDVDAALDELGGSEGLQRKVIFALINVERTTARAENRIDRVSSQARAARQSS